MQYEVLPVGMYEANCVVLWQDPAQAWIVDPGADSGRILNCLERHALKLGVVFLTHAHFDHISAVNDILKIYPVPTYLHPADEPIAFSPLNTMPPYRATRRPSTLSMDKHDGDQVAIGGVTAKIIHTPGHTPGGWCLYFEADKLLVAGDTLFAGSVGRVDLPGGSGTVLAGSLKRLTALPDDTCVICGHGRMTTIGEEKRTNPYL